MLILRKSEERGRANHGWLNSYHTFSFANYYDPSQMGFRTLRVINEDRVEGGAGFGTHSHQEMEIISYIIEGAIEHQDSTGTKAVIRAGEVQRMTAGTGIAHSEYNHSSTEPVHFLQIWIPPAQNALPPGYEQRQFTEAEKQGKLRLLVSPDGRDNSLTIHQDTSLYATRLSAGDRIQYPLSSDRHAWVQVIKGEILVNNTPLQTGDGAAISHEDTVAIEATTDTELILFDLA
jgi:redox-sensitive bicupin YhaK (pirin superfamily)